MPVVHAQMQQTDKPDIGQAFNAFGDRLRLALESQEKKKQDQLTKQADMYRVAYANLVKASSGSERMALLDPRGQLLYKQMMAATMAEAGMAPDEGKINDLFNATISGEFSPYEQMQLTATYDLAKQEEVTDYDPANVAARAVGDALGETPAQAEPKAYADSMFNVGGPGAAPSGSRDRIDSLPATPSTAQEQFTRAYDTYRKDPEYGKLFNAYEREQHAKAYQDMLGAAGGSMGSLTQQLTKFQDYMTRQYMAKKPKASPSTAAPRAAAPATVAEAVVAGETPAITAQEPEAVEYSRTGLATPEAMRSALFNIGAGVPGVDEATKRSLLDDPSVARALEAYAQNPSLENEASAKRAYLMLLSAEGGEAPPARETVTGTPVSDATKPSTMPTTVTKTAVETAGGVERAVEEPTAEPTPEPEPEPTPFDAAKGKLRDELRGNTDEQKALREQSTPQARTKLRYVETEGAKKLRALSKLAGQSPNAVETARSGLEAMKAMDARQLAIIYGDDVANAYTSYLDAKTREGALEQTKAEWAGLADKRGEELKLLNKQVDGYDRELAAREAQATAALKQAGASEDQIKLMKEQFTAGKITNPAQLDSYARSLGVEGLNARSFVALSDWQKALDSGLAANELLYKLSSANAKSLDPADYKTMLDVLDTTAKRVIPAKYWTSLGPDGKIKDETSIIEALRNAYAETERNVGKEKARTEFFSQGAYDVVFEGLASLFGLEFDVKERQIPGWFLGLFGTSTPEAITERRGSGAVGRAMQDWAGAGKIDAAQAVPAAAASPATTDEIMDMVMQFKGR